MSENQEPIGEVFCKGAVALGSGCMRCGRCAVALAAMLKEREVPEFTQVAHSQVGPISSNHWTTRASARRCALRSMRTRSGRVNELQEWMILWCPE